MQIRIDDLELEVGSIETKTDHEMKITDDCKSETYLLDIYVEIREEIALEVGEEYLVEIPEEDVFNAKFLSKHDRELRFRKHNVHAQENGT